MARSGFTFAVSSGCGRTSRACSANARVQPTSRAQGCQDSVAVCTFPIASRAIVIGAPRSALLVEVLDNRERGDERANRSDERSVKRRLHAHVQQKSHTTAC